jgi:ribosomal-protein-alanine N-acetyltransferase
VTLAVRESNLGAQLFFRMRGFRAVKVLRNYYEDSGEDAYLMQFHINQELMDEFEEPTNRIAQYHGLSDQ